MPSLLWSVSQHVTISSNSANPAVLTLSPLLLLLEIEPGLGLDCAFDCLGGVGSGLDGCFGPIEGTQRG